MFWYFVVQGGNSIEWLCKQGVNVYEEFRVICLGCFLNSIGIDREGKWGEQGNIYGFRFEKGWWILEFQIWLIG